MKKANDQYSDQEAQRRFMAALKAAVSTPPKPLKDMPKKNGESRATSKKPKRNKAK
jgi:hypothetical protein